jgi:hypothetical protein
MILEFVIPPALSIAVLIFIISCIIILYVIFWEHKLTVLGLTLIWIGLYPGLEWLCVIGSLLICCSDDD